MIPRKHPYTGSMTIYDYAWGGLLTAGLAFEAWALAHSTRGDTLSEFTRKWFRTGNPEEKGTGSKIGRASFAVVWVGFAAWYTWHILYQVW